MVLRVKVKDEGSSLGERMESHTTRRARAEVDTGREGDGNSCLGHAKLYAEIIAHGKSFLIITHMQQILQSAFTNISTSF